MTGLLKLFGFALLGAILWRTDREAMATVLARTDPWLLLVAISLNLPLVASKAIRWNLLLKLQGHSYSTSRAFLIYFAGIYAGLATPGRLGEIVRVLYARRDLRLAPGAALSTVVVDRLFDLYALVTVTLLACFSFNVLGDLSAIFLLGVVAVGVSPFLLLSRDLGARLIQRGLGFAARRRMVGLLMDGTADFFDATVRLVHSRLLLPTLLTLVSQIFFFTQGWLLCRALHIDIPAYFALLALGAANLVSLLPITIAGVGTRDAVLIACFALLGLAEAEALAFSALILVAFWLAGGAIGFACFALERPLHRPVTP